MKQLKYIMAFAFSSLLTTSCVDDFKVGDAFLEKAPGVDVNIDTIFSKAEYTRNFLWSAYSQIYCTYHKSNMMNGAPIDVLSDSYHCYCGWGGPIQSYYPGNLTEDCQDTDNGNFQGKFSYSTKNPNGDDGDGNNGDGRVSIYETVRKCWQLIENIDRVPDMSDEEKSRLRGEAYTIMASRYFDAFRSFGGLCIVDHASATGEDFTGGRSTALQTVEFIDSLIQKAIDEPGFIWNVKNEDVGQWEGRLTRASARALRCKLWMHAASPLFNSNEPYMQYDPAKVTEFTNIEHVWFGAEHPEFWQKCLDYCNDFFADNEANGNFYALVKPETEDEAGYRMAFRNAYRYRNTEKNHEKLFDAHITTTMSQGGWGWGWNGYALDCIRQGGQVPTAELMECFGMADGTNYQYADADIYGEGKKPGIDIFENRDPRLYETIAVPRHEFPSGIVGDYRGHKYVDSWEYGVLQQEGDLSNTDDNKSGLKRFKWFFDHNSSKMDDKAIGIAYIRLAEVYLIKAEAEAELGKFNDALNDLAVVRSRVGLGRIEEKNPDLKLTSNKENLINEILRERNCEIGAECGDRVYDMIRRKRQDLFCKPLHELHTWRLDPEYELRMPYPAMDDSTKIVPEKMEKWRKEHKYYSDAISDDNKLIAAVEKYSNTNTSYKEGEPWPKLEYDRNVIVVGARRWWQSGFWTNKWYLDPVSRKEVQKGYGLTQNPGW